MSVNCPFPFITTVTILVQTTNISYLDYCSILPEESHLLQSTFYTQLERGIIKSGFYLKSFSGFPLSFR